MSNYASTQDFNVTTARVLLGAVLFAVTPLAASSTLGAQQLPDLRGKPEATIADPFTQIAGLRELPDGRAIVTDQTDQRVVLVDFRQRSARVLGRAGDGPGEYRFPMAPLAGVADTTWVYDATLRRLHVIASDGRFVRGILLPTSGPAASIASVRGVDRSGRLYLEANSLDRERGTFSDSVAVVRWDPLSGATSVVSRVWGGGRVELSRPDGPVSLARGVTPFPHLDAWVTLPDGHVAIVKHHPFRVDLVDSVGRVRPGLAMEYTPVPVTAADRNAYRLRAAGVRRRVVGVGGGTGGMQLPGRQFDDEEFPRVMPPFVARSVVVSPEGEVWVGRSHRSTATSWQYDVFAASGHRMGSVTLNVGSAVVGFGRGTVYVARADRDDDLIYLERYRR